MFTDSWFTDLPVLAALSPLDMMSKLHELEDEDASAMLQARGTEPAQTFGGPNRWFHLPEHPWHYTTHCLGYLAPFASGSDAYPIAPIDTIVADPHLQQARLRITLNRLRIAGYPGRGNHQILLHCFALNQARGKLEPVHFNATYRVREGDTAAIQGSPLFVGLKVGREGLVLKCRTIKVQNEQDTAFLRFLDSDTFRAGVKLVSTIQPAIGLLSEMALALSRDIARHHRNISVQDFEFGLDFGSNLMSGRLAEGAYLAIQMPGNPAGGWQWSEWAYYPNSGHIAKRTDPRQVLPYNYLVFGISRYQER